MIENKESFEGDAMVPRPQLEKITSADLHLEIPGPEETAIVLQCNARDNRNPEVPIPLGALMPEAAEALRRNTIEILRNGLASLSPEQKKQVDFLVVAGDSVLGALEPELKSSGQPYKRAVDSAQEVLKAIEACIDEYGLDRTQLLNKSGKPIELSSGKLRDLLIFDDSPEFVQFMRDKYGTKKEFWVAYEDDVEKETREALGAEGPREIAERIRGYLRVLANAFDFYHRKHPERSVIVWAVTHYDSISPFVKSQTGMKMTDYLGVDKGAGIVVRLKPGALPESTIGGHRYEFSL